MIVIVFISFIIAQTMWIWGAGNLGILLASFHMNAVPFYVMLILVLLMEKAWNWDQTFGAFLVALGVIMAQANWQKKSNF